MKKAGQIVLFNFPQSNYKDSKLRPALMISRLPGIHDDWLICMITSQTKYYVEDFDEIINEDSSDFLNSGLNVESLFRVGRLAVVEGKILIGSLGEIDSDRLNRIKKKIADWLLRI